MSDETAMYFGIDLGTTNSVISYIDRDGRPVVVRGDASTSEILPSIVYFENAENTLVGASAKNVARMYPDRVISRVKRYMGQEREWEFDGNTYTPESISSLILKQLAADAAAQTGCDVRQVVITVPAYFGMLERDATRNAGRIAGLDVIGILPEPVAAALQYDLGSDGERTVLVYDLGGGTFDTTVIRIAPQAIEVICTDGDQELGGVDWDDRLIDYLVAEFVAQAKPVEDPTEDETFMQEIAKDAEELKQQLSRQESRSLAIRFAGASAMVEVSRQKFEEITSDLLDNTIRYTDRTLEKLAAKLGVTDPARHIDQVLLVGGSTRMPAVKARLAEKYGWDPKLHDPDLSVAKGAARFALSRALWEWDGPNGSGVEPTPAEKKERVKRLAGQMNMSEDALGDIAAKEIKNVLPKAFGIKLVDASLPGAFTNPQSCMYIEHLVHADDTLPSGPHLVEAGTLVANQRMVQVEVYEQAGGVESREVAANKSIDGGEGSITDLPPLPAGSPINISMTVSTDGELQVEAIEPTSGKDLTINIRVGVLSDEQIDQAQQMIAKIAVRA